MTYFIVVQSSKKDFRFHIIAFVDNDRAFSVAVPSLL